MRRGKPRNRARDRGNPVVRAALLEVVDNQLRENDPPEVRLTLERRVRSGFSNEPFDRQRYVAALDRLPQIS